MLILKIAPDDSNNQLGLEIADTESSEPKSAPSAFQIVKKTWSLRFRNNDLPLCPCPYPQRGKVLNSFHSQMVF